MGVKRKERYPQPLDMYCDILLYCGMQGYCQSVLEVDTQCEGSSWSGKIGRVDTRTEFKMHRTTFSFFRSKHRPVFGLSPKLVHLKICRIYVLSFECSASLYEEQWRNRRFLVFTCNVSFSNQYFSVPCCLFQLIPFSSAISSYVSWTVFILDSSLVTYKTTRCLWASMPSCCPFLIFSFLTSSCSVSATTLGPLLSSHQSRTVQRRYKMHTAKLAVTRWENGKKRAKSWIPGRALVKINMPKKYLHAKTTNTTSAWPFNLLQLRSPLNPSWNLHFADHFLYAI